ncbi:MAG: BatA domain-containing protein [Bacteroidia bacterium]
MQFIYPGFLFALSALAIPVIIHLFNFRRFKKVYFTNVRFLREIKQDTQAKSRLKHILILIARLLAVTFLVLAFAQPILPAKNHQSVSGQKRISIYVDNSFSMDAQGKEGNLLESARKRAREIALAYKPSDQFQLLTTDFEGRHQRLVSREEFLQLLDEVKPGAAVHSLSEVVTRQTEALFSDHSEKISATAYIISDFQKSNTDLLQMRNDSSVRISLVPVQASAENNLYVDTVSLFSPFVQLNTPADLIAEVRNTGDKDAENIPVKLLINGVQKSLSSLTVPAGGKASVHLAFTVSQPGFQQAEISIADYPVTFDDKYYLNFDVRSSLNILSINSGLPTKSIATVFGNDPYFVLKNASQGQIDYSAFAACRMIILNQLSEFSSGLSQEVKKYVKDGGTLFIIPAPDANVRSYNDLMKDVDAATFSSAVQADDKVSKIESRHFLFSDIFEKGKSLPENLDLPVVHSYFPLSVSGKVRSEVVMKLQNGDPFLLSQGFGAGTIYTLATSLDEAAGNFTRHALFVPVMLKAAMTGLNQAGRPLVIGRDHEFSVTDTMIANDQVVHLANKELKFDIIPESRMVGNQTSISVHDQIRQAGNYELSSGGNVIQVESFNYDRHESDLSVYPPSELGEMVSKANLTSMNVIEAANETISHSIAQLNEGQRLWKYCIILTLVFLAIEILLIRFFRSKTV